MIHLAFLALLFVGCMRQRAPVGEPMVHIAKRGLEAKDLEIYFLKEQVGGLEDEKAACEELLKKGKRGPKGKPRRPKY